MQASKILVAASLAALILANAAGCGESVPVNPRTAGPKANPAMAQERINETLSNPSLSQAQKDQIIATIKQKNHLQ
jgi:hypothetical protein